MNLKLYAAIAALLIAFGAGCWVTKLVCDRHLESAVAAERESQIKACDDSKKITETIDHENITKITALNKHINDLKRLHKSECVSIASDSTGVNHGAPSETITYGPARLDAESLYDLTGEGDTYALTLESCQDFILAERNQKGK